MMDRSPQCYIPCFVKIGSLVPEKIFEEFFSIQGRGCHLGGSRDPDAANTLLFPLPKEAPHVYSPGAGADNLLGSNFLQNHKSSVKLVICCKFDL